MTPVYRVTASRALFDHPHLVEVDTAAENRTYRVAVPIHWLGKAIASHPPDELVGWYVCDADDAGRPFLLSPDKVRRQ